MKFGAILSVFVGAASYVYAQSNPISAPTGGNIQAGSSFNIKWTPSTGSLVTLVLRTGASNNLTTIAIIASDVPNTGSYDWNVGTSIPSGSDYTIEIIPAENPQNANYSPRFTIGSGSTNSTSGGNATTTSGSSMPTMTGASNSTSNSTTGMSSNSTSSMMSSTSSSSTTKTATTEGTTSTSSSGSTAPSQGVAIALKGSDGGLIAAVFGLAGLVALI